jgi:hypothetical protein
MHQTLKQETASPPERNLRRQQMAFLRFQQEYNQARPHEALQYETPASRYVGSERRYPAKLPDLEYPEGAHLRRVSHHGDVKLDGVQMFVSSLLAWEVVGLLELEQDPDWLEVYYGPLMIGWMDLRKLRLQPVCLPAPRRRHCNEIHRRRFLYDYPRRERWAIRRRNLRTDDTGGNRSLFSFQSWS